jgi:hypothetical protein
VVAAHVFQISGDAVDDSFGTKVDATMSMNSYV